jgi:hypothetical protein
MYSVDIYIYISVFKLISNISNVPSSNPLLFVDIFQPKIPRTG